MSAAKSGTVLEWSRISLRSSGLRLQIRLRDLAARCARAVKAIISPSIKRAQGRPGPRCTRGLVCNVHKKVRTRAYRSSGEHPAFPAQWLDGLCRALPGDEFLLPPSLTN